ncbi:MAG: hypothetical protein R3E39_23555 [Anaerolineae bacterium]
MSQTTGWYIENEIIYVHYAGVVTTDDMRASLQSSNDLIASSPRHVVHAITDVGDVTKPLNPKDSLEIIREITPHERAGWTVVLREKSVLIKVGLMFSTSVLKTRTKACATMTEANAFFAEIDPDLSWDKVNSAIIAGQ